MEVSTRYQIDDALVVANTSHGPGAHRGVRTAATGPTHDHLLEPAEARAFLADHAISTPEADPAPRHLVRLRALRTVLKRAAARQAARAASLDVLLREVEIRLRAGGVAESTNSGWDAVIDELILPLAELPALAGRLRRCGNASCRWIFVDRSRNASRRWCEMAICGNRAKGRRHRHRAA